jgi:hypothetical protein
MTKYNNSYYYKNFGLGFFTPVVKYLIYFSHTIMVSLKSPYSLAFWIIQSSVFGYKNNMKDYFNQILQLITNVNMLQGNWMSLCSMDYMIT